MSIAREKPPSRKPYGHWGAFLNLADYRIDVNWAMVIPMRNPAIAMIISVIVPSYQFLRSGGLRQLLGEWLYSTPRRVSVSS